MIIVSTLEGITMESRTRQETIEQLIEKLSDWNPTEVARQLSLGFTMQLHFSSPH